MRKSLKILIFVVALVAVFGVWKIYDARAAIALRAVGAACTGTTSVTCSEPAGTTANDILLAFIIDKRTSAGTATALTGWTRLTTAQGASGRIQIYWAHKADTSGTSWAFTTLTSYGLGRIIGYSGVNTVTPMDVTQSARYNATTTRGTTSITPVTNGDMIVAAFASLVNGSTWTNEQVATNPGALTEQADSATSTLLSLAIADGIQSTAGATGVSTSTMSTSAVNAGALISLRPLLLPTATTGAATLVSTSSATGNGNITNTGGENNDIRGFVYGTTSTSTTPGNIAPTSTIYTSYAEDAGSYGTGVFTKALTSLATSTTYYIRAYSHNSLGWSYGAEVSFTTLSLPTVTTQAASDVAITTATGNGNITSIGGENNNIRGFVYGTSTQSLPGNVAPTSTSYTSYAEDSGSYTTGAFTKALASLNSNTTYYIRAYSHNTTGYAYGEETQFTTSKPIVEFVAIVDPSSAAGTDFSSLFAWEAATQVDLTATRTMVFSISSASGTLQINGNVTGATSGAIASSTYHTATQVLLYNISGTFQSGETVYITGQATSSNYVILSNTGNPAIAVASCRSTDTYDTNVTIAGWTTDATHYIKIWTDPSLGNRHNGKWDDGKYVITKYSADSNLLTVEENYVRIDGLQFLSDNDAGDAYNNAIVVQYLTGASDIQISNSIIRGDKGTAGGRTEFTGIESWGNTTNPVVKIWNNLIYGFSGGVATTEACIWPSDSYAGTFYIYNNTLPDCTVGIMNVAGTVHAKNNLFYSNPTPASGTFEAGSGYNATASTSIGYTVTGGAVGDRVSQTFTFADSANNDFHLTSADSGARNYGTSTNADPSLGLGLTGGGGH